MAAPEYAGQVRALGLEPFATTGADTQTWVQGEYGRMRELARELALPVR